ncbi:MAG: hypothetical protein KKH61_20010 [Gammaproteobacteria bacterium]|nr:hypothetical protein [Gammaproteobacteria bacterium]
MRKAVMAVAVAAVVLVSAFGQDGEPIIGNPDVSAAEMVAPDKEAPAVEITSVAGDGAMAQAEISAWNLKRMASLAYWKQNWIPVLSTVGTVVALDRVADNNDWLWYDDGKSGDGGGVKGVKAGSSSVSVPSITSRGDTVIVIGNSAPVNVIRTSETGKEGE